MLATLNVEHHFVRRWGLANRVVVLDEVHADDTYTSGLIEALLRWLKALRCSVVLMSAKLPAARLGSLLRAWSGSAVDLPKLHYPRVLAADATGVRGEHAASRPQVSSELRAWSVCRAQPWAATAPSPEQADRRASQVFREILMHTLTAEEVNAQPTATARRCRKRPTCRPA